MGRRTTRWVGWIAIAAGLLAVSGCIPATPPPSYPNPKPVVTLVITPVTPVAGQPVTFEFHATHPVGVTSISTTLTKKGSDSSIVPLADSYGCGDDAQVWSGPATDRTITISCTFPAGAPRGSWKMSLGASAPDSASINRSWTFNVDSPSKDVSGPVIIDAIPSPVTVSRGDTVVLNAHLREEHGPVTVDLVKLQESRGVTGCVLAPIDASTAPLYEISITCQVTTWNTPFTYVTDAFGFKTLVTWFVVYADLPTTTVHSSAGPA